MFDADIKTKLASPGAKGDLPLQFTKAKALVK